MRLRVPILDAASGCRTHNSVAEVKAAQGENTVTYTAVNTTHVTAAEWTAMTAV